MSFGVDERLEAVHVASHQPDAQAAGMTRELPAIKVSISNMQHHPAVLNSQEMPPYHLWTIATSGIHLQEKLLSHLDGCKAFQFCQCFGVGCHQQSVQVTLMHPAVPHPEVAQ